MSKAAFEARKIIKDTGYDAKIIGEINGITKLSIRLKDDVREIPLEIRDAKGISIDPNVGYMTDILGIRKAIISVYRSNGTIEPASPLTESLSKFNERVF